MGLLRVSVTTALPSEKGTSTPSQLTDATDHSSSAGAGGGCSTIR
jgi:hypothetical protein